MTRPLYLFDLDGTLANIEHRLHYIQRPSLKCCDCGGANYKNCVQCSDLDAGFKPNWDAFHLACVNDEPIPEMIELLHLVCASDHAVYQANEIWIWSGRMSTVEKQTVAWLMEQQIPFDKLRMRPAGDYTPDDKLKESWLHALPPEDRARLRMVFDDRRRVVDMWRRNGVRCLHVAEGEF